MDYVRPDAVIEHVVDAGAAKARLGAMDLLIRGALAGALLGFATTLGLTAKAQTGLGVVGALVFPARFVMIVLLGLELVTGNFALLPVASLDGKVSTTQIAANWAWVFLGNLLGALLYAVLFHTGVGPNAAVVQEIVPAAESKTIGYLTLGPQGLTAVVAKAVLCNWMVTLGVVLSFTSRSTVGKIAAMWLPILMFFAQGFEHSVVNMSLIPLGILFGAKVTLEQWWMWNQIPVTLGNVLGGSLFTGIALYLTYRKPKAVEMTHAPAQEEAAADRQTRLE